MNQLMQIDGNQDDDQVVGLAQSSRATAEVQAAMVIAKKFPRDETAAFNKIIGACKRLRLAENAMYSYPRGGKRVAGPSIRLAESMAQCWGNLDFGVVELEQRNGESVVMSYCIDLETNTRQTKVFTVKHERSKKSGNVKLADPRDIYEIVANQGARRLRACILGIIPGDIQDAACDQVAKTIADGDGETPLIDRVRKMVLAFGDFSVTKEMIEDRLQHPVDSVDESEFVSLRSIYTSLKDGLSKREDWFEFGQNKQVKHSKLNDATKKGSKESDPKPDSKEPDDLTAYVELLKTKKTTDDVEACFQGIEAEIAKTKPKNKAALLRAVKSAVEERLSEVAK